MLLRGPNLLQNPKNRFFKNYLVIMYDILEIFKIKLRKINRIRREVMAKIL